jgi:predicted SAM-dependent methyltransferase
MKSYLNLGCGTRFHPDWMNIDFVSSGPEVMSCDLRKGIPFPDASFEVIYHSHLLEHFPRAQAAMFLQECHRVLKSGGILRIVVPDLEGIVRSYLSQLEKTNTGDYGSDSDYDWMTIELLDQLVREKPGGDMLTYLSQAKVPNPEFVISRIGTEARNIMRDATNQESKSSERLSIRGLARRLSKSPNYVRQLLLRILAGADYELLQLGRFRRSGETHLWMYDRYSLPRALTAAGFLNPQIVAASESQIPDWHKYGLDVEPDGSTYKPDSLFVEAIKREKAG